MFAGALLAGLVVGSAPAASATSNLVLNLLAGNTRSDAVILPTGQTATVKSLSFKVGMTVENVGPDQADVVRLRLVLPAGLRWGTDLPDPSENCTSTPTTAECRSPYPLDSNDLSKRATGWGWDVTADAPGTYILQSAVTESSSSDPDISNNSSSASVAVTLAVAASAAKVSPARAKAGSVVSARVAVTAGGEPVTPTDVSCSGRIGNARLSGARDATAGAAICRFRTPRRAAGKTLRGTIAFTANGTKLTRRFAVKLR